MFNVVISPIAEAYETNRIKRGREYFFFCSETGTLTCMNSNSYVYGCKDTLKIKKKTVILLYCLIFEIKKETVNVKKWQKFECR